MPVAAGEAAGLMHHLTTAKPTRRAVLGGGLATVVGGLASPAFAAEPPPIALTAAPGTLQLRPEPASPTAIIGWNGAPSALIARVRQGVPLRFDLRNGAAFPVSLHLKGSRGPNASDGVIGLTTPGIAPGASARIEIPTPDAGFFLLQSMAPGGAAEQAERGLQGVVIVDEADPPQVDHDILLLLDDWRIGTDHQIEAGFDSRIERLRLGRLGNVLTVNGIPKAHEMTARPGARLRIRIANLTNARTIALRITNMKTAIFGVSGHPASPFEPYQGQLTLIPGGRFDLICDLSAASSGESTIVAALGAGVPLLKIATSGTPLRTAAAALAPPSQARYPQEIVLGAAQRPALTIERTVDPADAAAVARTDPSRLWRINGRSGDFSGSALFSVRRGAVVALTLANRSDVPIALSLHGHVARLLHPRDDGWEPYWIDTVYLAANREERIAFIADNPGRWMIGGRILEHLAGGQFGWFSVD